jgi:Uma2 family endonuclease
MAQAVGPYTIEMLERFPADGKRYEILDGALIVTPAPSPTHQAIQWRLGRSLGDYVESHHLGQIFFGPADVIFDAHTLLEPDLLVALGDEVRRLKSWRELPDPALAVEILSPSSARHDRGAKRERYLHRVSEYWIVDIEARLIERWRPGDARPSIHRERLDWSPTPALPPLVVDVGALFAEVPEPEADPS